MDHAFDVRSNSAHGTALNPLQLLHVVRRHVRWLAIPAVVCTLVAAAYSIVAPRHWQATQGLIIRPEAASVSDERTGKFSDLSEMKTLQETILELAKSQSVVQATLREVGPPRGYSRTAQWPTPLDVEKLRKQIDMRPPGGAEFGKTEVFYLSIENTDRQRASVLVAALCGQLEQRMQEIRDQRAQGMVTELERTIAMADGDLAKQTQLLSVFEARIGADLAELRNLNADIGGQGAASQELQTIEAERRANEARQQENERLLKLLAAAQEDPHQLLATPNSLLKSQPAVAQLKTALVSAEVQTANLLGSRSERHPFVVAAREAEVVIRRQLHDEISTAIRGLKVDIELNNDREHVLAAKASATRDRLARLAESRAEYSHLVDSVANHTRLVEAARKNLADARGRQAGARSACVISRIDGVEAGVWPVGPGRKSITAAGGVGGLLLGFGLVFLFAAPASAIPTNSPAAAVASGQNLSEQHVNGRAYAPANASPRHVAAGHATASNCREASVNGLGNGRQSPRPVLSSGRNFGIFRGMTLEEAIRSVQERNHRHPRS